MEMIEQVRRFNRTITRKIGALHNHFLGRERSLGASRLLFEIGSSGIEIRELRSRLGLDSGYTSRLLRTLETEGLVRTGQAPNDTRVRFVKLTKAGVKEVALLNRLSDNAAASILEPLNEKQRSALATAMNTVEGLIRASSVSIAVENPSSRQAQQCIANYYNELGERFDDGFNPEISISAAPQELIPPKGFLVVATLDGEAVGCGALKCHSDFGEIKRMWVATSMRGLGIGKRILQQLEELARKRKLPTLRLETNKTLTEAKSLYLSSGYREVKPFNSEPYAHHWFEKNL